MKFSFNFRYIICLTKDKFKKKKYNIILFIMFFIFIASPVFAQGKVTPTQDLNTFSTLLSQFQAETAKWEPIIRGYSLSIFKSLLIIDFSWLGIRMALKRAPIEEILSEAVMLILFAAIMLAVVFYYKEWANSIMNLFSQMAQDVGAPSSSPSDIFKAGISLLAQIWEESSVWSPVVGAALVLCAIAIVIIFSMITAQMIVIKCEAFIVLNAATILLGLGGAKVTRDYATNFLRYALSVAMKLFVMQLLVSLSITFINNFMKLNAKNYQEIFVVLGASVVMLALTMSLPDVVAGIVNGSHVSSGNSIASAVTAVSAGTMAAAQGLKGAAGGSMGAVRSISAIKEASSYANSSGKSGLGKLGHMAATGMQAMRDSQNPNSQSATSKIRSSIKAQHEAFKMQNTDPK